jgi:nitrogen regulatory protein PII
MKKLEVVMKPSGLDLFKEMAPRLGISEYDVSQVRISPNTASSERRRLYRGQEYAVDLLARIKVELRVIDQAAKSVARDILAMLAPDRIAISTIDEVLSASVGADHDDLSIAPAERGSSEIPRVIH